MLESFPYHGVPDGAVFAPHHIYIGALVALGAAWVVADDIRDREPVGVVSGLSVSLFGFALTWPYYPVVGALLTLGGLGVASISLTRRYWFNFPKAAVVVAFGVAIAADDALEHAFGWPMPLDWFWKVWLSGWMA